MLRCHWAGASRLQAREMNHAQSIGCRGRRYACNAAGCSAAVAATRRAGMASAVILGPRPRLRWLGRHPRTEVLAVSAPIVPLSSWRGLAGSRPSTILSERSRRQVPVTYARSWPGCPLTPDSHRRRVEADNDRNNKPIFNQTAARCAQQQERSTWPCPCSRRHT
jgi:hypothetical protein